MAFAWLLTLLALGGVAAGVFAGNAGRLSEHLAAAGGGLLFGIAAFWLIPEVGQEVGIGIPRALLLAIAFGLLLAFFDRLLAHPRHSADRGHSAHHGVVWPLLAATAIHSLLDGYSVRLLSAQPMTNVLVLTGLALHKVPEGAALGWVARRIVLSPRNAFLLAASVELFTPLGAFTAPILTASGTARFGVWWPAGILSLVAGAFLFLGLHALHPVRKRPHLFIPFFLSVSLAAAFTFLRRTL